MLLQKSQTNCLHTLMPNCTAFLLQACALLEIEFPPPACAARFTTTDGLYVSKIRFTSSSSQISPFSNELFAHAYAKLYSIPSTGLRFFTVYGPAGRPDMAYFGFTNTFRAFQTYPLMLYRIPCTTGQIFAIPSGDLYGA